MPTDLNPATPLATLPALQTSQAVQATPADLGGAYWRSERGTLAPRKIVIADDTLPADTAYRLACEGTGLLWQGDFQNARLLLQALARRVDRPTRKKVLDATNANDMSAAAFNRHRQAAGQRARVLGMLLLRFGAGYTLDLRRAPSVRVACTEAWGAMDSGECVASLRDLLGAISAHEWHKKGVAITALGEPPDNRIHPHYGVFSPVRGEYIELVAAAPLPAALQTVGAQAFDIGTGTGVLAAVLARRGVQRITASDQDPRALACARDNIQRLGLAAQVEVVEADLFSPGRAALIVCNPPWLPARPGSPLERAVYDEGSAMLLGFLNGLAAHLESHGEGWLIVSNFAELLGLRATGWLAAAIEAAGLRILGRLDSTPGHAKATDTSDSLHAARAQEITTLWRLAARP